MPAMPASIQHLLHPLSSAPGSDAVAAGAIDAVQLYQHATRPQWGLAIRVRERDGRYDFQFQDGVMRAIAGDYLHLLETVDRPADETSRALRELTAMGGMALARSLRDEESEARTITLDEQVEWFVGQYPDGFDDASWRKKIRGEGQRRRAKSHREPAIAEARELLSRAELDRLIAESRADEVVVRAARIMAATSLITKAQQRPLDELEAIHYGPFAKALRDLLYGDYDLELRVARLVQIFRRTPTALSWSAATLWLALVFPEEHICVRPNVLGEQARWMAPLLRVPKRPDGRIYRRLRDMALAVRQELAQRDLPARDLMDIYDFVWCTLRPAARKAILAQPPAPRVSQVRAVDGASEDEASEAASELATQAAGA